MKVGILSFEQYNGSPKNSIGSSRIRCTWVLNHWPQAEAFKIGVKYDAIIFQKAYFKEYLKVYDGIKILDLCDPDWLENKPVVELAEQCDAVTVSSQGLYDYLSKILKTPVYFVPDRVDMDLHWQKKKHEQRATSAVWFGYHQNQEVLDATLPTLKRLGLNLTVIADLPYYPTASIDGIDKAWINSHITNIKFDPESLNDEIVAGGDFVLNNRPVAGKYLFKSENKTHIAWALGMPVAKDAEDVERFMDPIVRTREAETRLKEVMDKWQVEESVKEYEKIIEDARTGRAQSLS